MTSTQPTKTHRQHCANCRKPLTLGTNLYGLQEGVIGPRGFVPLEDPVLLCTMQCVRAHGTDVPSGPERIP